jgi:hypothetical protein
MGLCAGFSACPALRTAGASARPGKSVIRAPERRQRREAAVSLLGLLTLPFPVRPRVFTIAV